MVGISRLVDKIGSEKVKEAAKEGDKLAKSRVPVMSHKARQQRPQT